MVFVQRFRLGRPEIWRVPAVAAASTNDVAWSAMRSSVGNCARRQYRRGCSVRVASCNSSSSTRARSVAQLRQSRTIA